MRLDDLVADLGGLGDDQFIRSDEASAPPAADTPAPQLLGLSDGLLASLDVVQDLEMELTVELGRTQVTLTQLMQVRPGDQFLLEESTDRLLRIYASDRLIAHGEAVVVDGMLAVRLVDILSADPS